MADDCSRRSAKLVQTGWNRNCSDQAKWPLPGESARQPTRTWKPSWQLDRLTRE